jgi:hypothetical protein
LYVFVEPGQTLSGSAEKEHTGEGTTVIVNVFGVPGQTTAPLVLTGVTVIVATTFVVPLLIATKEGINGELTGAEPLAANPIDVLSFVQLYAVAYWPVKFSWLVLAPLHTV